MSPGILALVLFSAALHATWNLWAKQIREGTRGATLAWLLTVLSALFYLPVAIGGWIVLGWRPDPAVWPWVVGSAALHVVYFLVLLRGYRLGDLSVVYPVARGTGPLLAAAGAVAWLGERPTPLSIAGALLVGIGVLTLAVRPGLARDGRVANGVLYGLLTGGLIAAYTLWDARAVKHLAIPPLLYYWLGEVVRVVLYSPLLARDPGGVARLWREHRRKVIGIAALSPLAYILILLALRDGAVSHIAPARELSILIGAWLGGQMLGEGERPRRLAAAAAFAAGVVALAFA